MIDRHGSDEIDATKQVLCFDDSVVTLCSNTVFQVTLFNIVFAPLPHQSAIAQFLLPALHTHRTVFRVLVGDLMG